MLIFARGPFVCFTRYMQAMSSEIFWIESKRIIGPVSLQTSIGMNWRNPPLLISSGALPNCKLFHRNISYLDGQFLIKQARICASMWLRNIPSCLVIVLGRNGPKFNISPPSEFRNSNLLESAQLLFGTGTGCARWIQRKEMTKSYLTMDDGAKAAAEAVKAMIPARENFIFIQGGNA